MAQNKRKKDIVKMLLKNKELENEDEAQLMEILFNEPLAIDVDKQVSETETFGDRVADKLTAYCGSWGFIIVFTLSILVWMGINIYMFKVYDGKAFDPYPFILLNLVLSCVSALQAPVIMMSQNRSAKKDSLRGKNDYKIDLKSELLLEDLHNKVERLIENQNRLINIIVKMQEEQNKDE